MRRRALLAGALAWPEITRAAGAAGAAGAQKYDFTLTGGEGQKVTAAQFRGRYLLLFFGYTGCPDVCPVTLHNLALAMQRADPAGTHFAALFVSLDTAHDSPADAARYAALFSPRIVGASGTAAQMANVTRLFHVYAAWQKGPDGPLDHSALIYVLAPDGTLATVLPGGLNGAALTQALARWASR